MRRYATACVTTARGEHLEGPVWDARTNRLLWLDQFDGLVHLGEYDGDRLTPVTTYRLDGAVGAVVPRAADDGFVAACGQGFELVDADGADDRCWPSPRPRSRSRRG